MPKGDETMQGQAMNTVGEFEGQAMNAPCRGAGRAGTGYDRLCAAGAGFHSGAGIAVPGNAFFGWQANLFNACPSLHAIISLPRNCIMRLFQALKVEVRLSVPIAGNFEGQAMNIRHRRTPLRVGVVQGQAMNIRLLCGIVESFIKLL